MSKINSLKLLDIFKGSLYYVYIHKKQRSQQMNLQELRIKKESLEWELENGLLFQDSYKKDLTKVNKQLEKALKAEVQELRLKIKTSMFLTKKEEKELKQLKAELASLKEALK